MHWFVSLFALFSDVSHLPFMDPPVGIGLSVTFLDEMVGEQENKRRGNSYEKAVEDVRADIELNFCTDGQSLGTA